MQRGRVSNTEYHILRYRVAEPLVQSARVSSAEWQSLQRRVAESAVRNVSVSGNVSSAEWQSLLPTEQQSSRFSLGRAHQNPLRRAPTHRLLLATRVRECESLHCGAAESLLHSGTWQSLHCGVADSPAAECRPFPLSHHASIVSLLPPSPLVRSATFSSAQYTLQNICCKVEKTECSNRVFNAECQSLQ